MQFLYKKILLYNRRIILEEEMANESLKASIVGNAGATNPFLRDLDSPRVERRAIYQAKAKGIFERTATEVAKNDLPEGSQREFTLDSGFDLT